MSPQNCVSYVTCEIDKEIKFKFNALLSNVTTIANLITHPQYLPNHLVGTQNTVKVLVSRDDSLPTKV